MPPMRNPSENAPSEAAAGFGYSDGLEVERRLLEILRGADDLSSGIQVAAEHQGESWPVRYHLAAERSQLIRHLDFSALDVVELGAGMGGVSRFLAETAGSLLAVEGSELRLACLRERLRDLEGWSAVHSRIEDFAPGRTFDVVCVFGVLEYSELYMRPAGDGRDPFDAFLAHAASLLGEDGILLLAIENPLGIQYWTGVGEDHTGNLFDGVAGYSLGPSARTFSRRELTDRLARQGLVADRWYLPFPDYKLPASVQLADLVDLDADLAVDLACFRPFAEGRGRSHLVPDYLALHTLARAGHFAEFSNSFLVAATRSGAPGETLRRLVGEPDRVAWHYSPGRSVPTHTDFRASGAGVRVSKRAMDGADSTRSFGSGEDVVEWRAPSEGEVARGERLRHRLLRRAWFGEGDALFEDLRAFIAAMLERFAHPDLPDRLVGESLDAVTGNAVVDEQGRYDLFDLEWHAPAGVPASWLVLRNVLGLVHDAAFHRGHGWVSYEQLYRRLCAALALPPQLSRDVELEAGLRGRVTPRSAESWRQDLLRHLRAPLPAPPLKDPEFVDAWRRRVETLEELALDGSEDRLAGAEERAMAMASRLAELQDVVQFQQETLRAQAETLAAQQGQLLKAEHELAARADVLRHREGELAQLPGLQARVASLEADLASTTAELQRATAEGDLWRHLGTSARHRWVERIYGILVRVPGVSGAWRLLKVITGRAP
ncbi:MAG: methyltransferase domain-containing protein [Acidobacteriota bacterium]